MNYYNVGKIIATHGLKGEVKVALTTDFPEDRFRAGSRLYLGDDSREVTRLESVRVRDEQAEYYRRKMFFHGQQ